MPMSAATARLTAWCLVAFLRLPAPSRGWPRLVARGSADWVTSNVSDRVSETDSVACVAVTVSFMIRGVLASAV